MFLHSRSICLLFVLVARSVAAKIVARMECCRLFFNFYLFWNILESSNIMRSWTRMIMVSSESMKKKFSSFQCSFWSNLMEVLMINCELLA